MSFLLHVPVWLMILLALLLSIVIVFSGFRIIHKFYHYEHLEKFHNVTSYIFNAYGLLYAVVIAFVVYINWSDYNSAQDQLYKESNQISNLFHDVQGFQEPLRTELMKSIVGYTDIVNNSEIANMKNGNFVYENNIEYNKLWESFLKIDIKKLDNTFLYKQCLDVLNNISESRRFRYFYMNTTIPGLIWVIMLLGCIISFSFSFFFGMKTKFPHFLLVIAFTFINILLLYLIYVLDHPYEGVNSISYIPMDSILEHFKNVMSGVK